MSGNITIYLGDDTPAFHTYVKRNDPLAHEYKLNGDNNAIVWIKIDDYTPKDLNKIFLEAKQVIYCPPVNWKNNELEYYTKGWIEYISSRRSVKTLRAGKYGLGPTDYESQDFIIPSFLKPIADRLTDDKQIWMAGCSFTNGHGLDDKNSRFGQLFADNLNLPVSFLTMNGASNQWTADQILKADIRSGDILFFGVTGTARSTIYTKDRLWPITINELNKKLPLYQKLIVDNNKIAPMRRMITEEFLLSDHSFYESINHIEQAFNYLKKLKVNFLIGYFADLDFPYLDHMGKMMHYMLSHNDPRLFVIKPEYPWKDIIIRNPQDTNNDDAPVHHPGPNQHKIYANDLLSIYNELYQ
jgi:hypothetical protein